MSNFVDLKNMRTFLELFEGATDEDLMKSRFDCHSKGLHSIVLNGDRDGKLTRCYLAEESHKMFKNLPGNLEFELGAHNHRYDIYLSRIMGTPLNVTFFPNSSKEANVEHYRFKSGVAQESDIQSKGRTHLDLETVEIIPHGKYLTKDKLHTIFIPEKEKAAWLVYELSASCEWSDLYTNSQVSLENFYRPPNSADEVRNFVREFFNG